MRLDQTSTPQSQLTDHYVGLEDCQIFYQKSAHRSDSTPILFLHGWGISVEPYAEVLNLLAQQYTVFAPDLPSFARSSYSKLIPDYDSYAQLILSFLDALELSQVHVIGHSLGGGIAITLAAIAPDRVKSAILVGSTGNPTVSIPEMVVRRAIEMSAQFVLPRIELKLIDIPQVFSRNLLFNTGNVLQALWLSLEADLKHLMPKVQAPCLLLWSDKDLTMPLPAAQEMARILPNCVLRTVEEGYHEWGLWYPEKFTAIMLNFIHEIEEGGAIAQNLS